MNSKVKSAALCICVFCVSLAAWGQSYSESGNASWYGPGFHGRITASGERFDTNKLTAAHKTLPFGTRVRVTNTDNGKSVIVRINDRGPFIEGRVIDLSRAAAQRLNMLESGTAPVRVESLGSERIETVTASQGKISEKTVQVASFRDRANAERLKSRLNQGELSAAIAPSGEFFRVVIENVPEKELDTVLKTLKDIGYSDPLVR